MVVVDEDVDNDEATVDLGGKEGTGFAFEATLDVVEGLEDTVETPVDVAVVVVTTPWDVNVTIVVNTTVVVGVGTIVFFPLLARLFRFPTSLSSESSNSARLTGFLTRCDVRLGRAGSLGFGVFFSAEASVFVSSFSAAASSSPLGVFFLLAGVVVFLRLTGDAFRFLGAAFFFVFFLGVALGFFTLDFNLGRPELKSLSSSLSSSPSSLESLELPSSSSSSSSLSSLLFFFVFFSSPDALSSSSSASDSILPAFFFEVLDFPFPSSSSSSSSFEDLFSSFSSSSSLEPFLAFLIRLLAGDFLVEDFFDTLGLRLVPDEDFLLLPRLDDDDDDATLRVLAFSFFQAEP